MTSEGHAAHQRRAGGRDRCRGRTLRQGAPRAVRGVRAVPVTPAVGRRDRSDPDRSHAGGADHTRSRPRGLPTIGTPICFENSFPDIPRAMVNEGAGFLVVTVNNASYGFTAASDAASADDADPGHRGRAVGGERRRLGDQRVRRSLGSGRGLRGIVPSPLSCGAPSGPPTNARGTSGWGTGSPGSSWRSSPWCS